MSDRRFRKRNMIEKERQNSWWVFSFLNKFANEPRATALTLDIRYATHTPISTKASELAYMGLVHMSKEYEK